MTKKIALVTGGMGGIGNAICRTLATQGHAVISTYISDDNKAKQWIANNKQDGFNFQAYKCDVSNYDECNNAIAKIKQDIGSIDILINNAGITRDATLKKMTKESWDNVLNINLGGVFNMTKHVLDDMLDKGWGRIINISSINGQKGQFGQSNYSAAKAGVHGFTMAVAQEVARKGITVNTVAPGYIATEMVMSVPEEVRTKIVAGIPIGRLGNPDEIAALVGYLASDIASFITGAEIAINGGQHMM